MFASEQYYGERVKNRTKKAVFESGMGLVKRKAVKTHFTYKELSLIVGILVALIIAFTLFFRSPSKPSSFSDHAIFPTLTKPEAKGVLGDILIKLFVK